MKSFKFIKNISAGSVTINGVVVTAGQTINISDYSTLLKTTAGFADFLKYYSSLAFYDITNSQLTDSEFTAYFNYFNNNFLSLMGGWFKIYEYLTDDCISLYSNFSLTPKSVDYVTDVGIRFAREETFVSGFLTNVQYYESSAADGLGGITYSNPILNVNVAYSINSIGYVTYRETNRKWVKNDGTYSSDVKKTAKLYSGIMSREEAVRRRSNVINSAVMDIVNYTYGFYSATKTFHEVELLVMPIMDALEDDINKYIKGNMAPLVNDFSLLSLILYPWLNITVGSSNLQTYVKNNLMASTLTPGTYSSAGPS